MVLIKNDSSPVSFPLLNPYGHVAFQAQRGDVHTVIVDGRRGQARAPAGRRATCRPYAADVEATVEHLGSSSGEEAWPAGMNPELPDDEVLDNPYQYTEFKSDARTRPAAPSSASPARDAEATWPDVAQGPDFVESLARGLDVLACFDADHRTMTLSEVAAAAGLARPTARRLLLTLEELGFVRADDGALRADPEGARRSAWRTSARSASGTSPGPTWRRWSAQTGESSSMAQLDGSDIVYVARVSVPKIIALRVDIGTRFPAAADLAGQGPARRPLPRRRWPSVLAQPSRAGLPPVHRAVRGPAARRADRGAGPRLGAGRRGAGARRPLGRGAGPRRRRRACGPR